MRQLVEEKVTGSREAGSFVYITPESSVSLM